MLLGNRRVLLAGGGCTDQTQVINGVTFGYTTNAASIYDPFLNSWTVATPMNDGRDQFGMVTLNTGNALAFFGCSGGCLGVNVLGQPFSMVGLSAEVYGFDANQWTPEASFGTAIGNLSTGNLNQPAVVLQSGQVLACNGGNGNTVAFNTCEIYDPSTNSWSATGSLPANEFGIHQMALLGQGRF